MTMLFAAHSVAAILLKVAVVTAVMMAAAVVVTRIGLTWRECRERRLEHRYAPAVRAAIAGDTAASQALVASPGRHRLAIAALLIEPLIADREPDRIARTRALAEQLALMPVADRYLTSPLWWRRALALRALGLMRISARTPDIVAALDDPSGDVRAAALDALADLANPDSVAAIVVRLHDATLHRGRRMAALAALGSKCESMLLELARVDPAHLAGYAAALGLCGTARARRSLAAWAHDRRAEVRAGAIASLAHVGLDDLCAPVVLEALADRDETVRAMAAGALRGWPPRRDTAARLAWHLDDAWPVATRAANTLREMGTVGLSELQARAGEPGLAGVLARQMIWEAAR